MHAAPGNGGHMFQSCGAQQKLYPRIAYCQRFLPLDQRQGPTDKTGQTVQSAFDGIARVSTTDYLQQEHAEVQDIDLGIDECGENGGRVC